LVLLFIRLLVMVILLMIWLPTCLPHSILTWLGLAWRLSRATGPKEEIAHDGLHPLRKRGKAFAQVGADGCTMNWILQNSDEAREDSILIAGQQVAHPIERLNDAHGGAPGPVQAAGGGMLKFNGQVAEPDGF